MPSATRSFTISSGPCSVPSDATAISGNVTVAVPAQAGYVTLFPADLAQPFTTTLSFAAGRTRASNTVMPLSFDGTGAIKVFNGSLGTVDFILDVVLVSEAFPASTSGVACTRAYSDIGSTKDTSAPANRQM